MLRCRQSVAGMCRHLGIRHCGVQHDGSPVFEFDLLSAEHQYITLAQSCRQHDRNLQVQFLRLVAHHRLLCLLSATGGAPPRTFDGSGSETAGFCQARCSLVVLCTAVPARRHTMTEQLTRGGVAAVKAGNSTDPVVLQVDVILKHMLSHAFGV